MLKALNMKRKLLLILFGVIGLQGCTLEGGCEYYYSFATPSNYYCDDVSDPNILGIATGSDVCFVGHGNTFHEGSSCNSLGYSEVSDVGDYRYNANNDPSPYGAYAYASASGGGSSSGGASGGGGGTTCDWNTVWTGSPNDTQVSTQCQTACVYADAGNEQGRAFSCEIIAKFGATSSCSICP